MSLRSGVDALAGRVGTELRSLRNELAGKVAADDPRLTDARDPTAHTQSADTIVSGYLSAARLPAVLTPLRAGSASGSLTLDAARDVGGTILNITVTGNLTLNAPVNGIDGQVLRFRFTASGGGRRVSFASAIVITTGLSSSYDVPSGQTMVAALERVESRQAWLLTAATIG